MKQKIRIAAGQGFLGDLIDAPYNQATGGDVDYIMMDYLAEVTMSILQKQKLKDPKLGYARDIPPLLERLLPVIREKNIKVITNGGGVNPAACRDAIFEVARKITAAVEKVFSAEGSNIGINNGEAAGQEVPHVHVHVIPRKKGDGGRGIKSIVWTEPDTNNLEAVAEKIRRAL